MKFRLPLFTSKITLFSLIIALAATGLMGGCSKQEKLTNQQIYLYQGPDRDQRLVERAKKEGALDIYTTMMEKDMLALTEAFAKKYGVKVTVWRAQPDKVVQRALIEAKAGRHAVDVLEMNGPDMETLYREKLLAEFYSPYFGDILPAAFPPHKHYAPDRFNFFVMAYNTKAVKPEQAPNSYQDLLNPKWKGKIAMERSDVDWFASIVKNMGETQGLEYFKKLAALQPQMREGHTILVETTASGETPISLNVYNHAVEKLKSKEATIAWKPLQPAFGRPGAIGLAANAPHPYTAVLFADFVLSKEGQQILLDRGRVPSSRSVDSPLNKFEYQLVDPAIMLDEWDKWSKLWSDLFLGGKAVGKGD